MRRAVLSIVLLISVVGSPARGQTPANLLTNGSFEFWDCFGEKALEYKKRQLWTPNPAVPVRWTVSVSQPSSLAPASECHGGKSAVAIVAHRHALPASLELYEIEVMPKAAYSFGFWFKGNGRAKLAVGGIAVEGRQKIAEVDAAAGKDWIQVRSTFTVPRHIRTVCLNLSIPVESNLLIDDVFLCAPGEEPFDADAVLAKKYGKDEHTLLFEDFDGASPSFLASGKEIAVTDEKSGRFGRGLRLDRKGSATIPLGLGKMPEEGTLELWISPDSNDGMPYLSLMENRRLVSIGHWPARMETGSDYPGLKDLCSLRSCSSEIDVYRMRKGVWHHVAFTWDRSTTRLYIDGVLSDMNTVEAVQWPAAPSFLQLSHPLGHVKKTDGTIDEIRLSSIRRYGPAVPRGSAYVRPPFVAASTADSLQRAGVAKPPPPAEKVAEARKRMIGTVAPSGNGEFEDQPNPDGDYLYEAAAAKPIVQGGRCDLESDRIVKGLTVVRSDRVLPDLLPDHVSNAGVYWALKGIKKGPYWIGVLYTGNGVTGTNGPLTVYLNGRIVQLATHANPIQVAPDQWLIEALAGKPEELRPGDEITAAFNSGAAAARLILHSKAPAPVAESPWRTPTNFGGNQWNPYTALGVNVEGKFMDKDGKAVANLPIDSINQAAASIGSLRDDSGKVNLSVFVSNPLPIPVTVDYQCVVKTFHAEKVAGDAARITLQPHERIQRKIPFDWKEGEQTHFADIVARGVKPPDLSRDRADGGLGWPRYEVLSYFPGQRHILKWPDPFDSRVVRRITILEPFGKDRLTYGLDGHDWEMGYTTELEPPFPAPAEIQFAKVRVPKAWAFPPLDSIRPRPHGAYFRRTLDLPDDTAGRSFKLVVDHVECEATAYVNGQKTGNVRGEDTPLVCDISRALKRGRNEIVIVVRDLIAIMDPSYVNKKTPVANINYLDAPGIFGGNGLGIGPVRIESAPAVSSEEVFISTSVRNKRLAVKIAVANRGATEAGVRVAAEVLDGGQPIFNLGEKQLVLGPNRPVELMLERAWENPQLWQPGTPHLYAMRVTIRDAASGRPLDVRRDRFGFRESWIAGPNIMFNGYPIKPVGHGPIIRFRPQGNFLFVRGGGRDWLDEVGILGYKCISGLRNTPSQHNIESDTFWKAAEQNNLQALRIQQNSPHILAWDLSNEWLCFFWGDAMQGARRFKALSDAVRAYDPTRWTLANAEGDLVGLLDNHSFHYMKHYFGPPNDFTMNGRFPYLPDEAFWRPLDRQRKPGEEVQLCPIHPVMLNPDRKVIMDNEYLWKVGEYMPPGMTRVIGEDDVLSPAVDSSSGPAAWMWKTLIDGHRDLGVSNVNVYSGHAGVVRGGFLEQTFIIPENQHHGFAGSRQTRRFTVVNSLFRTCRMALRWKLSALDGREQDTGERCFELCSGGLERGEFSFALPEVSKKERHVLNVTLASDGEFVCAEEWDLEVYPAKAPEIGTLGRTIVLYDPEGATGKALEAMKVPFTRVDSLAAPAGTPSETVMILGENALNQFSAGTTASLSRFTEQGGRLIVLAQQAAPVNLPVETSLEPRNWSSQVYVRAGSHPILKGIHSYDLHFWQPDRSVAIGAYRKPSSGAFITLLDASHWKEMEWVPMMELFQGKGSYLLCQLPLASRFAVEPMAGELLARIVNYSCHDEPYACPVRTLWAVTEAKSETAAILEKLQIKHRVVGAEAALDADSPVLLDADAARSAKPEQKAQWANRLQSGAKVVLVNAEPQDAEWISRMAGAKVTVGVPPYRLWDGRGFRRGWSKFTAGLSHLDLYWKQFSGDERAGGQAEDPTNVVEPVQHYCVSAEGGRELVFPGMLVELPCGSGLLLCDQRRWTARDESLSKLAMRNVSSLMTSLDVGMSSYVAPRELPRDLSFRTVDLSSAANYQLQASTAAVSGQPRIDLRDFPEGTQNMLNVPFLLPAAPKTCVALASALEATAGNLPKEAVVPVGFLAEGLYFVHAAANAGGRLAAKYRVVYENGGICDVPVKGGVNVADWNALRTVSGADIAWTGSNDEFPLIGVYRMLWVNPRPDTPIKEVVFANPEMKSFPVLIGITAASRRETMPVSPGDAARAKKSLKDGRAAFKDNRIDDAYRLLREAVVLDPSQEGAYQALADAAERKGIEDWILDAYRLWTISGPRRPLPWNRIGEILENRKEIRGALEAYRKSLQIEWNQPPTMEAVKRLESALRS